MDRKTFIQSTLLLSAGLLIPLPKLGGKNKKSRDETQVWPGIIDYARWCASPHNVQPWKIKIISGTEADLYYDPARLLPVVDATSAFTIAGMGMFIESLNIAAYPLGYSVSAQHSDEASLDFSATKPKFFAKLTLSPKSEQPIPDRELIKLRKTSRLHYDGKIIDPLVISELQSLVHIHGSKLNYSSGGHFIHSVLELNSHTIVKAADEDAPRMELAKWIRTTDQMVEEKKDGLSYKCMQLPGKLMYNFFNHHERFSSKWKRAYLDKYITHSAAGTGNLGWISGPFENRKDWVKAGAMLQRLWLQMTKYNVYLQPLGAIINEPWALKEYKEMIKYDEKDGSLWLLFRMGYSHEPPRSLRLEVKDILI